MNLVPMEWFPFYYLPLNPVESIQTEQGRADDSAIESKRSGMIVEEHTWLLGK